MRERVGFVWREREIAVVDCWSLFRERVREKREGENAVANLSNLRARERERESKPSISERTRVCVVVGHRLEKERWRERVLSLW